MNKHDLNERIQQFEVDQILRIERERQAAEQKKKSAIAPTSKNPYVQARHKILSGYPEWRQKEIAEMEKTGNVNNRFYEDFVREIISLGELNH